MLNARDHLSLKVVLLVWALSGCAGGDEGGRQNEPDAGPPADSGPVTTENASVLSNPDTGTWTAGLTAKPGSEVATLSAVRTATHEEYERIVFEFSDRLPGYKVEYIDRPVRQCGSGDVVELPGDAWLSVQLQPANAHTEEGKPTVAERARTLTYANMKALRLICDFEAVVEWVVAVGSPNRYRTLELREPPRLVIDIRR